jgi:hypothetical protein
MTDKAREALEDAYRLLSNIDFDEDTIWMIWLRQLSKKIRRALTEPLRNCDVGTVEEQTKRFQKFCLAHNDCYKCDCPCNNSSGSCQIKWAQLPYKKEASYEQ